MVYKFIVLVDIHYIKTLKMLTRKLLVYREIFGKSLLADEAIGKENFGESIHTGCPSAIPLYLYSIGKENLVNCIPCIRQNFLTYGICLACAVTGTCIDILLVNSQTTII